MRVDVVFRESDMHLDVQFESVQIIDTGGEPYEGAYSVTPKTSAQTLPTRGKRMAEDVTVRAIPIYSVSNNSGGNTVYIAQEVE